MQTPSHYCDVMIKMPEVAREIHARIFTAVHFVIKSGHQLGVTWPDWKTTPGQFGYLCRIFGSEEAVSILSEKLDLLVKKELVRTFPVSIVPSSTKKIVFVRDRRLDKFSPSAFNRLQRRAQSRGEVYEPKPKPEIKSHYLRVQSGSTNQEFGIYIRRESTTKEQAGGHEYGLGFALPDF